MNKIYEIDEKDNNYPQSLKKVCKTKPKIYAMGNLNLLKNKSIAIVGSRKNTEYGEKYAAKFAYELSNFGITVVSGLAIGIDTIAHKYSMENKGHTIAVLGSGLKKIYPPENKELFYNILKNDGCVISKEEPGEGVDLSRFPKRNEIISGISNGVLVIEARKYSGSGITAKYGFKQNKPVFCVPNKLDETTGVGTNNLIKKGAKLITNVNEILETIGEGKTRELNFKFDIKETKKEKITKSIDEQYMPIYEMLQKKPIEINELARKSNKSIIEIEQKITIMEIEGLIEILPRKYCKNKGVICIINNLKENTEKILPQNIYKKMGTLFWRETLIAIWEK